MRPSLNTRYKITRLVALHFHYASWTITYNSVVIHKITSAYLNVYFYGRRYSVTDATCAIPSDIIILCNTVCVLLASECTWRWAFVMYIYFLKDSNIECSVSFRNIFHLGSFIVTCNAEGTWKCRGKLIESSIYYFGYFHGGETSEFICICIFFGLSQGPNHVKPWGASAVYIGDLNVLLLSKSKKIISKWFIFVENFVSLPTE